MGTKNKVKNEYSIKYCIEYDEPIEISEFTKSLNGFSGEYKKFINDKYGSEQPIDAKLYIEKIEEGSVLTTLVEYAVYGVPFLQNINTVFEFGIFIKEFYGYILGGKNEKQPTYDLQDLKNLQSIIQPGTEKGNKITIDIKGDNNNVQILSIDDIQASAISDRINKEKKVLEQPDSKVYKKQAFYFDQAKKDIGSRSGNYGIIENIYPFKLKVIFEDDKLDKTAMLHGDHNPLMATYIVDVEIQMVKEQPKIYKILKLHEIIEDDE